MNIFSALKQIATAYTEKSELVEAEEHLLDSQQRAMMKERILQQQLKKQLESLVVYIECNENIRALQIEVAPEAVQFMPFMGEMLDCRFTQLQSVTVFLMEHSEVKL